MRREACLVDMTNDEIREFATATAPLFIGFIFFVQEEVLRKQLKNVFFFAREGEFFLKLYEVVREHSSYIEKLPKGKLLEVSRVATLGPSLASLEPEELMRLWNLYRIQTPRAFLMSLNLSIEANKTILDKCDLPLDEPIEHPWQDGRIIAFLRDLEFQDGAFRNFGTQRHLLLQYLSDNGLHRHIKECAVVDIGWRGTIQDNIATLLSDTIFHGLYLGLNTFLNRQRNNTNKKAFGPNLNIAGDGNYSGLIRYVGPIEMISNSASGSVIGYEQAENSKIYPLKFANERENCIFNKFTVRYQSSVMDVARRLAPGMARDVIPLQESKEHALAIWSEIIYRPCDALVEAYFELAHNETFGLGKMVEKSQRLERFWPVRALLSKSFRERVRCQISEIGWPVGYARYHRDWTMAILERSLRKVSKFR